LAPPADAKLSKPTLHRETGAKTSLDDSARAETARGIEAFRVRVADDVQNPRGAPARDIGAMLYQQSSDASFPEARLDEQRIELGVPVRARHDGCEADDDASRCATNT